MCNPTSAAALELQRLGATLIPGTFDGAASLRLACAHQTAIFLNVSSSFRNDGAEVRHAANTLCAGTISTLVYPSFAGIDQLESFPGWAAGRTRVF